MTLSSLCSSRVLRKDNKYPPATLRWGVNSSLIQLAMSLGEWQSNRLSKHLPCLPRAVSSPALPWEGGSIAPCLSWCSTSFSPGLPRGCSAGPSFGLLEGCNTNLHFCCCFDIPLLCSLSFPCTSALFLPWISHFPAQSFFTSFPSCYSPSLPRQITATQSWESSFTLSMEVQHEVSPTFQWHILLQLQTASSRSRAGVPTTSSIPHPTWSCFKNNISLSRGKR